MNEASKASSGGDGRGNFFAVDRRAWARVCTYGLDRAIAYLVLARGTLGDMRTTSWSAKAVQERTDIPWRKAKDAVQALVAGGLVRQDKGGQHPRYYILPAHEVPGCEGYPRQPSGASERRLLEELRALSSDMVLTIPKNARGGDHSYAEQLVAGGFAKRSGNEFWAIPYDAETAARPDWIWLPIELIEGAAGEDAPVELIRQADSLPMLRLLVDLYHAQSLGEYGGIHWGQIRQKYTRYKAAERGPFVVWGFKKDTMLTYLAAPFVRPHVSGTSGEQDASIFWQAHSALADLGLLEVVGHLVTSDNDSGTVLHALPSGTGEEGERRITASAMKAAGAMLTPEQLETMMQREAYILVPVRRHIANVQLVGLVRLRYRAKTRATSSWFNPTAWAEMVRHFEMAEADARTARQSHVDINGTSTVDQRLINGTSTSR